MAARSIGRAVHARFMRKQHVNEEEAVQMHLDAKSKLSMGVHWGTFRLCDDPIEAPMDGLPLARRKLGVEDAAFVLFALGETRVLKPGRRQTISRRNYRSGAMDSA